VLHSVFSRADGRGRQGSCWIGCKKRDELPSKQTETISPEIEIKSSDSWLVKTTQNIRIPPRVKQMVVGLIEFPRRQEAPPLVCVEPAQLPQEGALAARGLSRVLPPADKTSEPRVTSHAARTSQLTNSCRRGLVNVMLVNFSQEEIVLPKATVVGVAEEISPCVVAEINDNADPGNSSCLTSGNRVCKQVNTAAEAKERQYLDSVLGNLTRKERAVVEPVLKKFRHVFHHDDEAEFKSTDLVEHRINTRDAKPIRKAPYRVPCALREEMEGQVRDMLSEGVIKPSSSP